MAHADPAASGSASDGSVGVGGVFDKVFDGAFDGTAAPVFDNLGNFDKSTANLPRLGGLLRLTVTSPMTE